MVTKCVFKSHQVSRCDSVMLRSVMFALKNLQPDNDADGVQKLVISGNCRRHFHNFKMAQGSTEVEVAESCIHLFNKCQTASGSFHCLTVHHFKKRKCHFCKHLQNVSVVKHKALELKLNS